MKIKKIQLGAGIMAFLVCLVMIVTVTYRAQAGEVLEKEPVFFERRNREAEEALIPEGKEETEEAPISEGREEADKPKAFEAKEETEVEILEEKKKNETEEFVEAYSKEDEEAFEEGLTKPKKEKEKERKKAGTEKREKSGTSGKRGKTLRNTRRVNIGKRGKTKEGKTEAKGFGLKLTEKDLSHLYRLVQSEVGYMDEKSKMLVASVVLNRVKAKQFPNTVPGVVLQKTGRTYQFSPVRPGARYWTCTVSSATKKAVDKVIKNGDYAKGALYFVAKRYTSRRNGSWFDRNLKWILHHGGQDYYS